jgi:hypothetical protein
LVAEDALECIGRAGGAGPGVEPRARLAHARGGADACRGGGGLVLAARLARGGACRLLVRAERARRARLAVLAGVARVARAVRDRVAGGGAAAVGGTNCARGSCCGSHSGRVCVKTAVNTGGRQRGA